MSTGSSLSDQVDQKPVDIYSKPGENAKITCSHSIPDYYRILWYKQSDGQIQFLGYMHYSDGNPESGVNVKIEGGARKDENCTLTSSQPHAPAVLSVRGGISLIRPSF